MPDPDVRGERAFYDHETEDSRLDDGRRRSVADWGVNEELFDRMPARRRFRPSESSARRDAHPRERRETTERAEPVEAFEREPAEDDREPAPDRPRRTIDRGEPAPDRPRRFEPSDRDEATRDRPRRFEPADRATDRGEPAPDRHRRFEPSDRGQPTPEDRARAAEDYERFTVAREPVAAAVREPVSDLPAPAALEPAPPREESDTVAHPGEGRRTVVIRGRGAEPAGLAHRERRPRTAGERLGPRPERLAAWAVALGVLLILIAILTAHG